MVGNMNGEMNGDVGFRVWRQRDGSSRVAAVPSRAPDRV